MSEQFVCRTSSAVEAARAVDRPVIAREDLRAAALMRGPLYGAETLSFTDEALRAMSMEPWPEKRWREDVLFKSLGWASYQLTRGVPNAYASLSLSRYLVGHLEETGGGKFAKKPHIVSSVRVRQTGKEGRTLLSLSEDASVRCEVDLGATTFPIRARVRVKWVKEENIHDGPRFSVGVALQLVGPYPVLSQERCFLFCKKSGIISVDSLKKGCLVGQFTARRYRDMARNGAGPICACAAFDVSRVCFEAYKWASNCDGNPYLAKKSPTFEDDPEDFLRLGKKIHAPAWDYAFRVPFPRLESSWNCVLATAYKGRTSFESTLKRYGWYVTRDASGLTVVPFPNNVLFVV